MPVGKMEDFFSALASFNDVARVNRFHVLIPKPQNLFVPNLSPMLKFSAESAELPGRTISTFDRKDYVLTEKMAMGSTFNEMTITFLCYSNKSGTENSGLPQKRFFDKWLDLINPTASADPTTIGASPYFAPNNMNYKQDYVTTIEIMQYDQVAKSEASDGLSYHVKLVDAFPTSVGSIGLNWGDDGVAKLPVTFAYTRWFRVDSNSTQESINTRDAVDMETGTTTDMGTSQFR